MLQRNEILVLVASFALLPVCRADVFYVSPSGDDANAGTQSAPWQTIQKANQTLRAGDTVYVAAGTYADAIAPTRSGTASAKITYEGLGPNQPILTDVPANGSGKHVAMDLSGRSHIVIRGFEVDGKRLSDGINNAAVDQFAVLSGSRYVVIENCLFQYANGWDGIRLDNDSRFNTLRNNQIDAVGTNHLETTGDDKGDALVLKEAYQNVIEGNIFTRGGHNTIDVVGSFNVIRGNTFDGEWWGTQSPGARAGGDLSGNIKYGVPAPRGFNLFEFNIIRNAAGSGDNEANPAMKIQGINQIVRGNYYFDNENEAVIGAVRPDTIENNERNHIYNNTFYNNGSLATYIDYGNTLPFQDNVWKNNLIAAHSSSTQLSIRLNVASTINAITGTANPLLAGTVQGALNGTILAGNVFEPTDGPSVTIRLNVDGSFISQDLSWFEQEAGDVVFGNRIGAVSFVDAASRQPEGFEPTSGSIAFDNGVALTTTSGSGSGNVIGVVDAGYFFDGFGIPGEQGDSVVIGSNAPVRITAVDFAANEVTVDRSVNWQSGDPVHLEYTGSGPDVGASELYLFSPLGAPRPAPPAGLIIISSTN